MKATLRALILAAVGAVALSASALAQTPLRQAQDAYDRGDYTTAASLFRSLAEKGDATAQYMMGFMYENGEGVSAYYVEAYKWYALAARQGDPLAADSAANLKLNDRLNPAQIEEADKLVAEWKPKP